MNELEKAERKVMLIELERMTDNPTRARRLAAAKGIVEALRATGPRWRAGCDDHDEDLGYFELEVDARAAVDQHIADCHSEPDVWILPPHWTTEASNEAATD